MQQLSLTNAQQRWCENQFSELFPSSYALVPLKVEASHRHFYRASDTNSAKTFILMVSPPELERNDAFVAIQAVFFEHRVPVPEIILANPTLGLFVLTDLGQQDFEAVYTTSARSIAMQSAINMLHILAPVRDSAIELYDEDRLVMELSLFTEWFMEKLLSIKLTNAENKQYRAASELLLTAMNMQPKSCVHRDYHCRNLLYNDQTLGIVDFQDALIGPCLYDLASLLHDCYHVFEEQEIDQWLDYFLSGTERLSAFSKVEVRRMLDFTAYQRQLKAIGIFTRLHLRDSKSTHLVHIVPLLKRMVASLSRYPELEALELQLTSCIQPAEARLKS